MLLLLLNVSVSPAKKPPDMLTVALARLVLSLSLAVALEINATLAPSSVQVGLRAVIASVGALSSASCPAALSMSEIDRNWVGAPPDRLPIKTPLFGEPMKFGAAP